VSITIDGLGDREFKGTLSYVAPEIDRHTRTAKGRVALGNSDGALRANMFGRARIATTATRNTVLVPRAAVQRARGAHLVFVKLEEDVYETRRVQVLHGNGEWVTISGRVAPGDEVVTEGSFLLKTETLKESIGAGCCDVE
jgi:cobalt-zinc-cadmium efflux system membrane fusion protein